MEQKTLQTFRSLTSSDILDGKRLAICWIVICHGRKYDMSLQVVECVVATLQRLLVGETGLFQQVDDHVGSGQLSRLWSIS